MYHLSSKKMMIETRKAIDLSAYSHICQRFLKEFSTNKQIVLWHHSFRLFYVVLGKIKTPTTHSWKWLKSEKKNLDKGNEIAAILMDPSKAFDTINHSLLLAKLEVYGFAMTSLKLMQSYFYNRFQKTSVNASFSDWK